MEANTQYALHDNEESAPQWAARVRLTPELLDKLRRAPEQVLLKLNVAAVEGSSKTRRSSKKTSLMTVKLGADGELEDVEEQYELLSFPEDPGINHVCTFRREAGSGPTGGYNIHKTGAIHQKLLLQRMLDATEKDRIKDKHAKSVLASKSRSSKLIDSKLEKSAKRQRLTTRLSSIPTSSRSTGNSMWSVAAGHQRTRKLVLPSALTKEEAKEAKEKIEKGFEVEVEEVQIAPRAEGKAGEGNRENDSTAVVSEETAAAARDANFHALFSSDSDDDVSGDRRRVLQKGKKRAAKQEYVATATTKNPSEDNAISGTRATEGVGSELDLNAQPKESSSATAGSASSAKELQAANNDADTTPVKQSGELDIYALKPIKPSTSAIEVKRARVRSALVSDRVKQARLPDLSFFPAAVVHICQRLTNYHGRSAILDDSDYDSFVNTHAQFRQDWEMLDKAYSIAMIKTEGLHLQLEVAADTNREQLEARIQSSSSKKEGLLFVRDAMASIQKILHSIQMSVDRFDSKSHTSHK